LPYPSKAIYAIIADVNSYSTFLPFCESSTVTKWSQPDANGQKWPSEAELVVGWKGVSEAFKSRIYCVPGKIVEAVGGETETTLPRDEITHHADSMSDSGAGDQSVLSHLLTRWTVQQTKQDVNETDVNLAIEFQFSNPIYSAMSSAVADKVAGYMIEAFESRVRSLLKDGSDGSMAGTTIASIQR
jgi:coenzyme Q-binding protein COQ10